jgi:hypothetical protein
MQPKCDAQPEWHMIRLDTLVVGYSLLLSKKARLGLRRRLLHYCSGAALLNPVVMIVSMPFCKFILLPVPSIHANPLHRVDAVDNYLVAHQQRRCTSVLILFLKSLTKTRG